jgi:hypothetical protein
MILVYSDSENLDLEWIPKLNLPQPYQVVHSFVEYRDTPADYKIGMTTHRLHCTYDENCTAYQGFEEKIIKLSEASNIVFTIESELHDYHWTMWDECHRDNVYWVLPGAVNDREDMNSHIIYWGDWFKTTTILYRALPDVVAKFTPFHPKPKSFDALLGCPKPHRDFVANAINQSKFRDQFVLSYGGAWKDEEFYAKDYFIWEPGCEPVVDIIGTADEVRYYGQHCHLSQVIPLEVFNSTAYSIIAETDHDNTLSFFSEKTAKPMIARRLFVAFTGYKFLHNLRRLGFRTFDGIIDESYDLIENDQERYSSAFAQVELLCATPQSEILPVIADIVEHNYQRLMSTDWTQFAANAVRAQIQTIFK